MQPPPLQLAGNRQQLWVEAREEGILDGEEARHLQDRGLAVVAGIGEATPMHPPAVGAVPGEMAAIQGETGIGTWTEIKMTRVFLHREEANLLREVVADGEIERVEEVEVADAHPRAREVHHEEDVTIDFLFQKYSSFVMFP